MSREELHRIVDTLPDAALEPAEKALQHFQIWPPQPPPEIARIQRDHHERMLRSMRPGTIGGFGGGGSYCVDSGGQIQHGRFSSTHWEEKTAVVETHHFHEGHEITVIEKLRIENGGKALFYEAEIVGPNGKAHRQEITFEVG